MTTLSGDSGGMSPPGVGGDEPGDRFAVPHEPEDGHRQAAATRWKKDCINVVLVFNLG
jgi:hypothetical protein